jgi:hypothetical protein
MPDQIRCFNPSCKATWIQRGQAPPLRCPRCQSTHWYNPTWYANRLLKFPYLRKPEPVDIPPTNLPTALPIVNPIQIPDDSDPGPLPEREDA